MSGIISDHVTLADRLLGFVMEELGKIETAKSITIKDAEDDLFDSGGQFAETLDEYENIEGKDLVFEDVELPDHGGIKKPFKAEEIKDLRSKKAIKEGSEYAIIWDSRRKCYVKRRKSSM